jgi:hypothetical protein
MKTVILGKAGSIRVIKKNYRPFWNGEFLTDILMAKLIKVTEKSDIYLSCEDLRYNSISISNLV